MRKKRFGCEPTVLSEKDFTARQLKTYHNTDPFDIFEICSNDGTVLNYEIDGVIQAESLSLNDVKEVLDMLAIVSLESELEENKYEYEKDLIEQDFLNAFSKALSDNNNDGAINVRTMIYYLEQHPEFADVLRNCGIEPDFIYW